jgi:hypothetical protein
LPGKILKGARRTKNDNKMKHENYKINETIRNYNSKMTK